MRALWTTLIGLCLIVGGAERAPRLELRGDRQLASISDGHAAVPVAIKLRRRALAIETGLGPATVPVAWQPTPAPPRGHLLVTSAPAGAPRAASISPRTSRGPPAG